MRLRINTGFNLSTDVEMNSRCRSYFLSVEKSFLIFVLLLLLLLRRHHSTKCIQSAKCHDSRSPGPVGHSGALHALIWTPLGPLRRASHCVLHAAALSGTTEGEAEESSSS